MKSAGGWSAYANSIGNTDEELHKFLKRVDAGKADISDIGNHMQKAGSATAKFGATLKTVAANVGIMLAITAAIKVATWAWDKFNTTVGEAQSDLEETEN